MQPQVYVRGYGTQVNIVQCWMLRTNYKHPKGKWRHLISSIRGQRVPEKCPGGKLFHRVLAR